MLVHIIRHGLVWKMSLITQAGNLEEDNTLDLISVAYSVHL